ncbi:unnamed protein product [Phytophthora fragariaefolia]|uniref:Unnamed protein product n=1 Tax=Phytophthora fragariaefolia TaxID=1490495 RepID=A0A9W6XR64_9STRA|nr:unnamed protein product [Phytophthora fragariaefolia]
MEYECGAENLPVDMNISTGSPSTPATHVTREDCHHLAHPEWVALQRLSTVIGEAAVATMLRTLSLTEQHGVALGFIMKEQRKIAARATVSTTSTPRVESLKLHVNSYVGREGEPLLRWLVEVDTAITARRIVAPVSKVAFAMSCLSGRARNWAYGRRLIDPMCFSTYEVFTEELRQAFEPPQNEFISRAEFLDLQQGNHDVHAYAQRARYLVSNIVTNPIDEATKVVTFMKSLRDGPVKTYLFREYPTKKLRQPAGAGPPAGDAVERVDIGHALSKAAAPSERHSHCKKDDKPNLVILKVNPKRESSPRALVDCGASNNFVRLQSLARLDFDEVELPRSLLEVRLATGVVVRTEKRVVRARFSHGEKKFVDEFIVLDLDVKFDMVLDIPWLARHDPVIDWAKRTIVRFTKSSEKSVSQIRRLPSDPIPGAHEASRVSTVVDTQVEQELPVTEGSDLGASAPGADAIGPNISGRSAVMRLGFRMGSEIAQARQAAQVSVRDGDAASSVCRADTATGDNRRDPECHDAYGYWSPVSEDGARVPSDASVEFDFTSSYELEAFRPRPARWTHRADLHPLGRREGGK